MLDLFLAFRMPRQIRCKKLLLIKKPLYQE